MKKTIPAVSIVIPMHNAEKYIGECLDSILAQTFQDFEVIVVDDCSTDNSVAVVESYLPKFNQGVLQGGDKLQLIRSEKHSGGRPAIPRNLGMRLSLGEYIMLVDSDDAITPTALDELYPIAKKFNADVVCMDKHYTINEKNKFSTDKKILKSFASFNRKSVVSEPTLVSDNISHRIQDFGKGLYSLSTVDYFVRREFIFTYKLEYPNLRYGEDSFFNLFLICLSKKLVRVPNCIYVSRRRANSISKTLSVNLIVRRCTDHVLQGISIISEFAKNFIFLKEHPELQYILFDFLASTHIPKMFSLYTQIPIHHLTSIIKQELGTVENETEIISFLFNRMNIFNLNLNRQGAMIKQMNAHIQKQNQVIQQLQARIAELQK